MAGLPSHVSSFTLLVYSSHRPIADRFGPAIGVRRVVLATAVTVTTLTFPDHDEFVSLPGGDAFGVGVQSVQTFRKDLFLLNLRRCQGNWWRQSEKRNDITRLSLQRWFDKFDRFTATTVWVGLRRAQDHPVTFEFHEILRLEIGHDEQTLPEHLLQRKMGPQAGGNLARTRFFADINFFAIELVGVGMDPNFRNDPDLEFQLANVGLGRQFLGILLLFLILGLGVIIISILVWLFLFSILVAAVVLEFLAGL